jgi:hypothetical protein
MVKDHPVHVGLVAHIRSRTGTDDHDRASLYVRTGDRIKRAECAHAELQRHRRESPRARIGISRVAGVQFIDGTNGVDTVEVLERLGEMLDVITGNLKNIGDVELLQAVSR